MENDGQKQRPNPERRKALADITNIVGNSNKPSNNGKEENKPKSNNNNDGARGGDGGGSVILLPCSLSLEDALLSERARSRRRTDELEQHQQLLDRRSALMSEKEAQFIRNAEIVQRLQQRLSHFLYLRSLISPSHRSMLPLRSTHSSNQ